PRPRDRFNVLFAGQLSQRKGISYLLRAYERIHGSGTFLMLVGQLQDDGRALRPWSHLFRHIPHVPRPRLAELFRQADVFVFPTLIEGMPLVVVEAMASGLPVITTPNGPGDIVRDGVDGFLVPPRDVDAIEEKLKLLRRSEELRAEMGRNARQRAQEFTWKNYRNKVLDQLCGWLDEEVDPVSLMRSSNG
ncbi:MAG: glycosyltransferase family 4 protein, partial [Rubrobacteraceae bacterium]|nr:glycosyltransferase family 4 protein [Rubrobacteraceae bacterium]